MTDKSWKNFKTQPVWHWGYSVCLHPGLEGPERSYFKQKSIKQGWSFSENASANSSECSVTLYNEEKIMNKFK